MVKYSGHESVLTEVVSVRGFVAVACGEGALATVDFALEKTFDGFRRGLSGCRVDKRKPLAIQDSILKEGGSRNPIPLLEHDDVDVVTCMTMSSFPGLDFASSSQHLHTLALHRSSCLSALIAMLYTLPSL